MADEKRAVPYAKGKALADEYKIRFFETSAKDNINVEEVRVGDREPGLQCGGCSVEVVWSRMDMRSSSNSVHKTVECSWRTLRGLWPNMRGGVVCRAGRDRLGRHGDH
jgi:hypothetical protein